MGQLLTVEPELNVLGFQIIGISPDKPEKIRETLERHKLRGQLLSDSRMQAAREFRVAYKVDAVTLEQLTRFGVDLAEASGEHHHMLPVPAVFLVGANGLIQFSYVNPDYKVRLDVRLLLEAARLARR